MKKKSVLKWLHRLPVLLLAMILAVMPVTMAAPARADVLTGSDIYIPGYSFLMESVFTDGLHETVRLYVQNPSPDLLSGYDFNVLVFDYPNVNADNVPTPGYYVFCGAGAHVDGDVLVPGYPNCMFKAILRQEMRDGILCIFLDLDYQNTSSSVFGFYFPGSYLYSYGTPVSDNRSRPFALTYERPGGVLSVFSGVASFMSGALQSATTMFWTAESGMTVLGYLAVASLSLAVILLIFYLIAGWLKFH